MPLRSTTLAAAAAGLILAGGAEAASLVALTSDGMLVRIDTETRRAAAPVAVRGADGRLLGIDVRPANGMLYGLTESGQLVTLDPATGEARGVAKLDKPFAAGGRAVVDFNPVADRLRVITLSGDNLRINVDTGMTVVDGKPKYQAGGPLAETAPRLTAGAYTNSVKGTQATALYTIDTLAGSFNLQAPPNDGVQQPKGATGSLPPSTAFDIQPGANGANTGWVVAGGALHTISLDSGQLVQRGAISGLRNGAEVIDIAVMD